MTLLCARGLGMARGARVLFEAVDLDVRQGEAVVLRGANGAGKTTLLRILAGLTRPLAGEVERAAPLHWFAHRDGLKPHETPLSHLSLWSRAWGGGDVDAALARVGLARARRVPARMLSAGQRRRAALARLLLADRPLWLLDEPRAALDSDGKTLLGELIAAHRAGGGGVVAAVHGEAGFPASREIGL